MTTEDQVRQFLRSRPSPDPGVGQLGTEADIRSFIREGRRQRAGEFMAAGPPPPAAQDVTRVAPPDTSDRELGMAAGQLVESTVGVPGITRPPLPAPESFITPELPEPDRTIAPADVTAVSVPPPPEPPTMRAAAPGELPLAQLEAAQREAAETEAERRRDILRGPLPGAPAALGDVARLAGHAGYGMQKLAGGLPARGLHAAAEAVTGEELREPKEIMEAPEVTGPERAAQVAGTLYGAGTGMAAQGRLLGRLGARLPEASRTGRALRAFDPARRVTPGQAAVTSAVEGLPIDVAYEADTPGERLANIGAGTLLGGALGPVFRRTGAAVEDVVRPSAPVAPRRPGRRVEAQPRPAEPPSVAPEPSRPTEPEAVAPLRTEADVRQHIRREKPAEAAPIEQLRRPIAKAAYRTPEGEVIEVPQGRAHPDAVAKALGFDSIQDIPPDDIPTWERFDDLMERGDAGFVVEGKFLTRDEAAPLFKGDRPDARRIPTVEVEEEVKPDVIIPLRRREPREQTLRGRLPDEGEVAVGRARDPDQPLNAPTRRKLTADLAQTLEVPMRVGRMRQRGLGRGTLGIFKPKQEVIRSKVAEDIETLAHEGAHHLHRTLFGALPNGALDETRLEPFVDELALVSYDGSLKEGFAEFVRRYVTNPDAARKATPRFFAHFEELAQQRWPESLEVLGRVRDEYKLWREAPAQARVRAQQAQPGDDGRYEYVGQPTVWSRIRTRTIDNVTPLRTLTKEARVTPEDIAADAGTLADLSRGSAGQAELMIEHGMINAGTRQRVGPSLKEVFDPVRKGGKIDPERYRDLKDYAIAKRAQYLYESRPADAENAVSYLGIEKADADQVVKELRSEEFDAALDAYQEWNRGLLQWLRDNGVISSESFERIQQSNEFYVPLMRQMDTEGQPQLGGRGPIASRDPTRRIKGSGRLILDPFEVSMQRAYEYTRLAAKQKVADALVRIAARPGMGNLIEEVPAGLSPFKLPTEDVLRQLSVQAGMPKLNRAALRAALEEGELPDELLFFRPSDYLGENTISVIQGGKRKLYQVDPDLYRALNAMDEEQIGMWTKLGAFPARTLRAGAILAPEFLLRNPVRDQLMAAVQSEWGYTPFVDLVRGMTSILRKDKYWQAFKAGGGVRSSMVGLDRKSIRKGFRESIGVGGALPNVVKNPIDLLRAASEFMEDATRVGETRKALNRMLKQDVPYGEAVQRSAAAGREVSLDFARHGTEGARLRMLAAFWNAQIQGYDKLARTFKQHPVRTTQRALAMITVPSVLEFLAYRDDPEYKEIPQWQRDLFWLAKLPSGSWLRIPKPFELGIVFGSLPQRMLEWADGIDREGVDRLVTETMRRQLEGLAPIPTFAAPMIDQFANHSQFLDRPIVPRSLEGVETEEQFTPYTSELAKQVGRFIGMAPAHVDNYLNSYTGGLGRLAGQAVNVAAEAAGIREPRVDTRPPEARIPGLRGLIVPPPTSGGESVERLYRRRGESEEKVRTFRKMVREGRAAEAKQYLRDNLELIAQRKLYSQATDKLSDMRSARRAILDSALPDDQKRAQALELNELMLALSAAVTRGPEHAQRLRGAQLAR